MSKHVEVRISGSGGQGVVLAGVILGRAVIYDGQHAVQTQSYGAEARGSAAKSEVIISDQKIRFPKVRRCDILVVMSQSALDKHLGDLKANGTLLLDEDVLKKRSKVKANIFRIPATKIAQTELKSRIYANVVMLGALARITGVVSKGSMEKAIADSVSVETREYNLRGFKKGYQFHE